MRITFEDEAMFNSAPTQPHAKDRNWTAVAIALFCGLLLWPQKVAAESTTPFAGFSGNWRGSGQVTGSNGNLERIRCRADYSTPAASQSMSQSVVCASDSYRFDIHS